MSSRPPSLLGLIADVAGRVGEQIDATAAARPVPAPTPQITASPLGQLERLARSGGASEADIEALAFQVLMDAADAARADVAASMAAVKAINRAKEGMRGSQSLGELGDVEHLRLQMALERMSKTMQALANVSARMAESARAIVGNLK